MEAAIIQTTLLVSAAALGFFAGYGVRSFVSHLRRQGWYGQAI